MRFRGSRGFMAGFKLASQDRVENDPPMTLHNPVLTLDNADPPNPLAVPGMQRARGVARLAVVGDGPVTRLVASYQSGSAKLRFPNRQPEAPMEAVLLNTAGGVTGGDYLAFAAIAGDGARAAVATQAAERIYRRSAGVARIDTTISVGAGATLDWLPQETILFDRSALARTLTADVHPTGRLLAVDAIVLGRAAMGETARAVVVTDSWRIRRGNKLVFGDGLRLAGDAGTIMAGGATGNGAIAAATLVLIAPDAEAEIDTARNALADANGEAGVSAWNGMLVARLIAATGQALRADLMRLIIALRRASMPRVWNC
jgi:urease accessory protein